MAFFRAKAPKRDADQEEMMAKKKLKELRINREWCKGCGICVKFCPVEVLELDNMDKAACLRPDTCICCGMCELRCPDLAIEVVVDQKGQDENENN